MKQWLLALVVLALAAGATWYLWQPAEEQGPQAGQANRSTNVNVVTPQRGEVRDRLQAVGTTMARNSVDVVSEVPGRIVQIHFEEGQRVSEDQVLVTLDQRQTQADLAVAQARLADAEAKFERANRLRGSNSIAAADVDELRASLAVARANLESARTRLGNQQVRAPFDGVVGLREVSVGAYLNAGQTITTLDSTEQMQVRFDVPQRYLGQLREGQEVEVGADALDDNRVPGEVTELGSRVDPLSRTLTVQSRVDNVEGRLRPGQFVNVALTLETRSALLIPEQAVLTRGRENFVFTAEDGAARRVSVTLGSRTAGQVEVVEGVQPDDRVIVNGQDDLRSGDRLKVLEDDRALLSRGLDTDQSKDI